MNLILLRESDFTSPGRVRLIDRRAAHIREVLRAEVERKVTVGLLGGFLGTAVVLSLEPAVELEVQLDQPPPPRAGVELVLALPRPKILAKVLQAAASLGVGRIALVGSYRVEKSYFQSPTLETAAIAENLELGLEQGRDTLAPLVSLHRHFKPFVEDALPELFPLGARRLAHPKGPVGLEALPGSEAVVLAVGPEGGWTPYEAEQLQLHGFAPFTLGARVLRVDVAVPYLLGQLALRRPA